MSRFGSSLDRAESMISNFQDRYIENTQTETQLGEKQSIEKERFEETCNIVKSCNIYV